METAIIIGAITAAAAAAAQGVQASSQASAQAKAYEYQAEAQRQAGVQASNVAAANMAISQRKSAADLGEQAAAFGEANVGTGGSAGQVMRQSATNARMDQLNIWYGGELERHQAFQQAAMLDYNARIEKSNATTALLGGGIGAGTKLLMGGMNYGIYNKYGISGLYGGGSGWTP